MILSLYTQGNRQIGDSMGTRDAVLVHIPCGRRAVQHSRDHEQEHTSCIPLPPAILSPRTIPVCKHQRPVQPLLQCALQASAGCRRGASPAALMLYASVSCLVMRLSMRMKAARCTAISMPIRHHVCSFSLTRGSWDFLPQRILTRRFSRLPLLQGSNANQLLSQAWCIAMSECMQKSGASWSQGHADVKP